MAKWLPPAKTRCNRTVLGMDTFSEQLVCGERSVICQLR
jgi:hypothetical protein